MAKSSSLKVEMRDPRSLTPYKNNAKRHSEAQIEKLAGLIAAFGFDQPIVIDKSGVIIKGHGRREAAIKAGLKVVPCVVSDKDEYANMANRIADNAVVATEYDDEKLRFDLGTLARNGQNLQLTGLDQTRLEVLTAPLELGPVKPEVKGKAPRRVPKEKPPAPSQTVDVPPPDEAPPGAFVYNLMFDDDTQQGRWYDFVLWLKNTYDGATVARRLDAFLQEHMASLVE